MKILFIAPVKHFSSMNFAVSLVQSLLEKGHYVDLVTIDKEAKTNFSNFQNLKVYITKMGYTRLHSLFIDVFHFAKYVKGLLKENAYDISLALSQKGLVIAGCMLHYSKIPLVYLNDEIWFGDENGTWWVTKTYSRLWKRLEVFYNKRVAFSVIQDRDRARLLAEVNNIPEESILLLPNSQKGTSSFNKSDFLQKHFSLPKDSQVLLWIGMVPSYGSAADLITEANNWPEPLKLIFHTRYEAEHDDYIKYLKSLCAEGKIFFSLKPVDISLLDEIISSAKIGLALYPDNGPNAILVGASSGKIASYLKKGIPAIVQDFPSLRWVQEKGCGVCVRGPEEVLGAAMKILQNYEAYSDNALRVYDEYISFDKAFEKIHDQVIKTVKERLVRND